MEESRIRPVEYDYLGYRRQIEALCRAYGSLQSYVIGRSAAGRDLWALRVGRASEYVLFAAAFHGSERITCSLLLRFLEELCEALQTDGEIAGLRARNAMFGRGLLVVPLVNPDGCEIALRGSIACGRQAPEFARLCRGDFRHWNANLRGVDLNHNFDAGWQALRERERAAGIYGPGPTRFGGFRPESEPETVALTRLCWNGRIRHVVAFHTQGEVIYWTAGEKQPARAAKMAEILATASGYALDVPVGLAEGGGFKDWFIETFDRPGFTVEVGRGENPLPASDLPALYDRLREMLMLAVIL